MFLNGRQGRSSLGQSRTVSGFVVCGEAEFPYSLLLHRLAYTRDSKVLSVPPARSCKEPTYFAFRRPADRKAESMFWSGENPVTASSTRTFLAAKGRSFCARAGSHRRRASGFWRASQKRTISTTPALRPPGNKSRTRACARCGACPVGRAPATLGAAAAPASASEPRGLCPNARPGPEFSRRGKRRPGQGRGWLGRKKLPRNPCADISADFVVVQGRLGLQRTQDCVDGGEGFRGFPGQESGRDPVGHCLHLFRAEPLQGGLDFGDGAHARDVAGFVRGGKSVVVCAEPRGWQQEWISWSWVIATNG